MRLGLLSALAIGIHNFPEGMATFVAALHDTKVGIPIAIAIALHNIPEGLRFVKFSQPNSEVSSGLCDFVWSKDDKSQY